MQPTYEVLAFRYATMQGRTQRENFIFPDDHAAPMPLDYFVFAIRNSERTIVVDTGFDQASAQRRGRALLCSPKEILAQAGIDAARVEDVILTHLHWDHAGGLDFFPNAVFHLQDSEISFATGRCMCFTKLRMPFDVEHVVGTVRALYADRIRFHDGAEPIAPGITLHLIGGHSGGIQVVRVPTKRGWVVLAGDTAHFWANIRNRNPFPIVVDVGRMMRGYETLEHLADGPDHIIPGHDPLILKRFPAYEGNTEIVRLDAAPVT